MEFKIAKITNNNGDELRWKGNKVLQMKPDKLAKKGYSRKKVIKEVNTLVRNLRAKNFDGEIMITLDHGHNRLFSGIFTDILTEEPDIIHLDSYNDTEYKDPEHYRDFRIYLLKKEPVANVEQEINEINKRKGGNIKETEFHESNGESFQVYGCSKHESKIIICRKLTKGQCEYYKDDIIYNGSFDSIIKPIMSKPISSGYLVIITRNTDDRNLKEIYDEFIETADDLLEATNGTVNMYKTGSLVNTSKYHFKSMMKENYVCEAISAQEAQWISNATTGSIQYAVPYEGDCIGYDINSFYPSILNSTFRIPIKQGKFSKITFDGIIKSNVSYGIYRCTINGDINKFLFRLNPKNYYTSIDINRAVSLGYEVKYIIDGNDNALRYGKDDFISAKDLFGKYIEYFYKLKQRNIKGSKILLTCPWGWLTRKEEMTLSNDGNYNINGNLIISSIQPINTQIDTDKVKIITNKAHKVYEHSFARFEPFLLSRSRELIGKIYENQIDDVIRCHTDGFIMKNKLNDVILGDELGALKIEDKYTGHLKISGINKIIKL